ncbi:MAG: hypothetical protein ACTHOU_03975 [Aureliella sp.]|jgi:hypothetical protein
MQINNTPPTDPALTAAAISNQIDVAVAVKARQVQKQQGDAIVQLVQGAAEISQQIADGHLDVRL